MLRAEIKQQVTVNRSGKKNAARISVQHLYVPSY